MKKPSKYKPTSFRLSDADMQVITHIAQQTNISNRTDIVRHALKRWLDELLKERATSKN